MGAKLTKKTTSEVKVKEEIVELDLDSDEREQLNSSADAVKKTNQILQDMKLF